MSPAGVDREAFYKDLWQRPELTSAEPNASERVRLGIISSFLAGALGAPTSRNLRLLDAGCGRGWLCPHLAQWGDVLGIDPLHASIQAARRRFPELRFAVCEVDALQTASFDVVVSSEVIEHTTDAQAYIASLARVLVPGGRLIITTPRAEVYSAYSRVVPRHEQQPVENWLNRRDLVSMCRDERLFLEAETRIFEPPSSTGIWRVLNSVKLNRTLDRIPGVRSVWQSARNAWALYFCAMFQKRI